MFLGLSFRAVSWRVIGFMEVVQKAIHLQVQGLVIETDVMVVMVWIGYESSSRRIMAFMD